MAIRTRNPERTEAVPAGPFDGPDPSGPQDRSRWALDLLRTIAIGLVAAVAVGALVLGAAAGMLAYLVAKVELPPAPRLAETTYLYDRDGERLAMLRRDQYRRVVPLERISKHLRNAVVAVEDKGFYDHGAIDPVAVVRATLANVAAGSVVEGGSTITQQYVKVVYTDGDRTLARKLREAALAIKLEQELSKDEILERYLNTIFFGHGAYGVEAAAQTYFDRSARRLTPVQAATLAGLIAGPGRWDPFLHPRAAERRRDYVLAEMVEAGFLGADRATELAERPLRVRPGGRGSSAPYFTEHVRRFLEARYGRRATLTGGLRVETTIDMRWQRAAEAAVAEHLPSGRGPQAALVAIDPRTGGIRALVGGADFNRSKFDLATQARRQTGSAFKPFVLAAALRQGVSPLSVRSGPSSLTITDERCETRGEPWDVSNYGDASAGTMTIAEGLASSVNTIYAQVALEAGTEEVAAAARDLGIRTRLQPVCSIALGTQDVTPLEMTAAYATIAAGGIRRDPTPVAVVRDADGRIVGRPVDRDGKRVMSRNDAATLTWAMEGVVDHGTGTAAALPGRPVAGKTGTSQDYTNAWFCGFVRQLVACVWVGYPSGNVPMEGVYGLSGVTGGSIPAAIWHDFMIVATRDMRVRGFPVPSLDAYGPASFASPYQLGLAPYVPPPSPPPDPDDRDGGNGSDGNNGHGNGGDGNGGDRGTG